jgi:hypothetical protein
MLDGSTNMTCLSTCGGGGPGVTWTFTHMGCLAQPVAQVDAARQRLAAVQAVADAPGARAALAALEAEAVGEPALWEDAGRAQALLARIARLRCETVFSEGGLLSSRG